MDNRVLPFATPGAGNEEDEAVAILAHVAEKLLEDHRKSVEGIRQQAVLFGRVAFGVAIAAWCFFLLLDLETAPLWLIILLVVVTILAFALGILLRTRLVDPDRFLTPRIRYARKYHWQWLAVAVDEERVLLWDTLSEDAQQIDFPQNAPRRPDWLLKDIPSLKLMAEEQMLVNRLGETLGAWQASGDRLQLPQTKEYQNEIVEFFRALPRASRRWEAAPAFPPLRPIEEGQKDMERLVQLQQSLNIVMRQLDAWEEAIPPFRDAMVKALGVTIPHMEAPPSPPSAHPSGDVEMLLGSLDLVRTNVFDALNIPLQDELDSLQEDLSRRLKTLEDDWQRERNMVGMSTDPVINNLRRNLEETEQRVIPQAEQSLRESRTKLREANERLTQSKNEIEEKRKQLLMAGNSSSGPKASDDRKRTLQSSIDQLEANKPTYTLNVQTWEQMVASHQQILDRERFQLERLSKEYKQYADQRDRELQKVDENFKTRTDVLRDQVAPRVQAIDADLAFFKSAVGNITKALDAYRVDLIHEDESERPYTQVVQQAQMMVQKKQDAIRTWADSVLRLIRERRATINHIIESIDRNAISPNFGVGQPRMVQLPVWYVEAQTGQVSLFPWQPRTSIKDKVYLLAPFEEYGLGQRMALVGPKARFMRNIPYLQQRLDKVLTSPRRSQWQQQVRDGGRMITVDPKRMRDTALACQMPLAMDQMVHEYNSQQRAALVEAGVVVPSFALLTDTELDDDMMTGRMPALNGTMTAPHSTLPAAPIIAIDAAEPDAFVLAEEPPAAVDEDDWLKDLAASASDDAWQEPTDEPVEDEEVDEEQQQS